MPLASEPLEDNYTGDPAGDPLTDAPAPEDNSQPVAQPGEGGTDVTTGEPEVSGDPQSQRSGDGNIEGTPFKDQASLAKGYKDIQRLVAGKDRQLERGQAEIAQLKQQLEVAIKTIQQVYGDKTKANVPAIPQGDEFWRAFSKDPIALISQIIKEQAGSLVQDPLNKTGQRLDTLESKLTKAERRDLVNTFIADHPELTQEEEDEMVEILNAKPWLKEQEGGLDMAYDAVLASKYRSGTARKEASDAVAGAKNVAGLGGKKTTLPSPAKPKGDIFDDVLELDKKERDLYQMGRKT